MSDGREKKILLLGAGLVVKPLVDYLLSDPGVSMTVATRTVSKAEKLVQGKTNGTAMTLLVDDAAELDRLVAGHDLVISLVPYAYHAAVARCCIKHKKQMVTTSYLSPPMVALNAEAEAAGIIVLNEIGLDPGIDHMSAMRVIDDVHKKGGKIASFESYCGGLPAPEANDNPYGYKFSWSPKGVVMAGRNAARFLKNGTVEKVAGEDLFDHNWPKPIEEIGDLEAYPNRDSVPYVETYGIGETKTMLRATLRYPGWCRTLKKIVDLGFLDDQERDLKGLSFADLVRQRINAPASADLAEATAAHLGIKVDSDVMQRLTWLGLFGKEPLPVERGSNLEILAERMLSLMPYGEKERDMIILHHDFVAEYPDGGRKEKITSSLIGFGIPGGDSAMSRTVSLPAAIATKLILDGKITRRGVCIPVESAIYTPVLNELERLGIECREKTEAS